MSACLDCFRSPVYFTSCMSDVAFCTGFEDVVRNRVWLHRVRHVRKAVSNCSPSLALRRECSIGFLYTLNSLFSVFVEFRSFRFWEFVTFPIFFRNKLFPQEPIFRMCLLRKYPLLSQV